MDSRERLHDPEEQLRAAFDAFKASLWTSVPCTVVSVDMAKQTAVLRPTIKSMVRQPDGTQKAVSLPLLQDVPMHFPSGGGVTMTFPVKPGDEALASISSRSIDGWHQSGGEQKQVDARTHDLSDAFAFVGFKSGPKALSNVSGDATQIRSDDGKQVISLKPGTGMTLTCEGVSIAMTSDGVAFTGGTVTHDGKNIGSTHKHSGITPGGALTGEPS